jgi:hypothetical protein
MQIYYGRGLYASWHPSWGQEEKLSSVLFKVDFEKAYDNVNWCFSYNVLVKKGFSHKWNDLVFSIMTSGRVNIKMNDEMGSFFSYLYMGETGWSFIIYSFQCSGGCYVCYG